MKLPIVFASAFCLLPALAFAQPARPRALPTVPGASTPAEAKPEGKSESKSEEELIEAPVKVVKPLGPKFIRLHLLDGSVLSGDLTVSEIIVDTQFGKLVVPIDKIRSLTPGLDSYPQVSEQISTTIENLGSDDYKTREQAHRDLSAMGPKIRGELEKHTGDENAEIKRHITEILKEFDEQAEEREDDDEGQANEQEWIRQDTVVTTDFTAVGRISPAEFKVESKYGPLTVKLADIQRGERLQENGRSEIRRSLSVPGATLASRGFKSSGIRVQAGDRVNVKSDGTIVMSPWGGNAMSTPEGMPNYGWYIQNQIPSGALIAKIGDKGSPFKVGRSTTFVAKTSGVLQFAIGMPAEYSNEGYQFPGEYKLKIKVDPK